MPTDILLGLTKQAGDDRKSRLQPSFPDNDHPTLRRLYCRLVVHTSTLSAVSSYDNSLVECKYSASSKDMPAALCQIGP